MDNYDYRDHFLFSIRPKIDSEDKDSQEALAKAVETITVSATKGATASAMSTSSLGEEERKLKTLHKKLDQIQKLKKKQEQGVKLEANQVWRLFDLLWKRCKILFSVNLRHPCPI